MELKPILLEYKVLDFEMATADVGWKDTNNTTFGIDSAI